MAAYVYHKIWYIASRPGVDLTPLPLDTPSDTESSLDDFSDASDPAQELYKRCTESPEEEINGLWGNFNVSPLRNAARHAAHQIDKGKAVFDGILSLREDDAVELGYDQKKNWYYLTQQVMPDVAKALHIPIENFTWCAVLHMTPGHIHIHYAAWNSGGEIREAFISPPQSQQIREIFSNKIFEKERLEHEFNETLQRNSLISLTDKLSEAALNLLFHPEKPYLLKEFSWKELIGFTDKLLLLSKYLPEKGKLQYGYLPFKVKRMMDNFVDSMLTSCSLATPYQKLLHDAAGKRVNASASLPEIKYSVFKAGEDTHRRLGNRILKICGQLMDARGSILEQWESHFPTDEYIVPDMPEYPDDAAADVIPDEEPVDPVPFPKADAASSALWTFSYLKAKKILYDNTVPNKTEAISLLENEAAEGNPLACDTLAKEYAQGGSVEKSPDKARKYYQKAIASFQAYLDNPEWNAILSTRLNDANAYIHGRLGNYYEHGLGVEKDDKRAISHYEKAAGNPQADYALANSYMHGQNEQASPEKQKERLQKRADLYKRAADHGHGPAAYSYARLAEKESNLAIPPEQVEEYYKIAFSFYSKKVSGANAPDSYCYRLGTMYYSGKGVSANAEKAYQCFLKASAVHNPFAQYALGKTYADPDSPHYNLESAAMMFNQAAGQGNDYAHLALGKLYLQKDSSLYDSAKAIEELEAALATQPAQANYQLGKLYAHREYGCFQPDKAIQHLLAACREENDPARYVLTKLYLDESLPCYQFQLGLNLLSQSANQGNPFAQLKLGCLYLWGHGNDLEQDEAQGKYWLNKAMEQDNETAKKFAQESLNLYQNYRNKLGLGLTCRLLMDAAQIISSQQEGLSDPYAAISSKVRTRESIKNAEKKEGKPEAAYPK